VGEARTEFWQKRMGWCYAMFLQDTHLGRTHSRVWRNLKGFLSVGSARSRTLWGSF